MYQRVGKAAYKADLSNTEKLMQYLGHPEGKFRSVHVAGTNGKGSTSHMLASVLQEAGYRTGLYTSPHLKDFRERIKIDGEMIPKQMVSAFIDEHKSFFEKSELSFFEMTVGLAFEYFAEMKVDIAVIEVGLGGRLDSTNVITPEVSVITNIGLDHTQFLGTTIPEIAREKAGIIKEGIPVVVGESNHETLPVFETIAKERQAEMHLADAERKLYPSDLRGNYQMANQRTVLATLDILVSKGWKISEEHIEKGLNRVVASTGLLGRWQILKDAPMVICDTAHNKEGLQYTLGQLQAEPFNKLHIVLGMVNDKNVDEIVSLFPRDAFYYLCSPKIGRALSVDILAKKAAEVGLIAEKFPSVNEAYKVALKRAAMEDKIYVGGSTFVVAEVL